MRESEVADDDSDFRRRNDHQEEDDEEEAEDRVDLMEQHGGHHEIDLEEDGAEGDAASHEAGKRGMKVPRLGRNLPLDVVGSHRHVVLGELVGHEATQEGQRNGDGEPESRQLQHGGCS